MSERDPYQVLGINTDAGGADIARAYRRLARAVHPDSRPGDPAAADQFRVLSDAYGLLSDPARRAAYDHQLAPGPARPPAPPGSRGPDRWVPRSAGPDLRPARPAVRSWAPGGPVRGAALRAGPVHIQPYAPAAGEPAGPLGDPELVRLLFSLIASGREWPW
jgi:curved DNA-binding protein CbpA